MHVTRIDLLTDRYPTQEHYPFRLTVFQQTHAVELPTGVTFFVGRNGSGKSTFLEAVARRCNVHIWREDSRGRVRHNPYEQALDGFLRVRWTDGVVPGSFFAGQTFEHFAVLLEQIAADDPGLLDYFGGRSLVTQSHGESLMSYFRARYRRRGIYFLDEPETALSPAWQVSLVRQLRDAAAAGHAQFLIATHSPILLACPGATIYSFDESPLRTVAYDQTEQVRVYREFLADPQGRIDAGGPAVR